MQRLAIAHEYGDKSVLRAMMYLYCIVVQRLAIAREYGDKSAERRAYNNMGNCHIFLGEFQVSVEKYK